MRFFFHHDDGRSWIIDEEGKELPGVDTARQVAVMTARSLVCDDALQGRISLRQTIRVTDETGAEQFYLPSSEVVEIES